MEEEDVAMWSTLRKQRTPVPKGWSAMLEIFAGCAVLTSVFQAAGYKCCAPLDILKGWDVHSASHREMAEKVLFEENPYLLTFKHSRADLGHLGNVYNARRSQMRRGGNGFQCFLGCFGSSVSTRQEEESPCWRILGCLKRGTRLRWRRSWSLDLSPPGLICVASDSRTRRMVWHTAR